MYANDPPDARRSDDPTRPHLGLLREEYRFASEDLSRWQAQQYPLLYWSATAVAAVIAGLASFGNHSQPGSALPVWALFVVLPGILIAYLASWTRTLVRIAELRPYLVTLRRQIVAVLVPADRITSTNPSAHQEPFTFPDSRWTTWTSRDERSFILGTQVTMAAIGLVYICLCFAAKFLARDYWRVVDYPKLDAEYWAWVTAISVGAVWITVLLLLSYFTRRFIKNAFKRGCQQWIPCSDPASRERGAASEGEPWQSRPYDHPDER